MRNYISSKEIRAKKEKERDGWRKHNRQAKTRLHEFLLSDMWEEESETWEDEEVGMAEWEEADEVETETTSCFCGTGEFNASLFSHGNYVDHTVWVIKRHYFDREGDPHSSLYTICNTAMEAKLILAEMDYIYHQCANTVPGKIKALGKQPDPHDRNKDELWDQWMDHAKEVVRECFSVYDEMFNHKTCVYDWVVAFCDREYPLNKVTADYYESERRFYLNYNPSDGFSICEYEVVSMGF